MRGSEPCLKRASEEFGFPVKAVAHYVPGKWCAKIWSSNITESRKIKSPGLTQARARKDVRLNDQRVEVVAVVEVVEVVAVVPVVDDVVEFDDVAAATAATTATPMAIAPMPIPPAAAPPAAPAPAPPSPAPEP